MRTSSTRRLALAALCLTGLLGMSESAMAVSWGTLTAYHDSASSGEAQAQGKGNFYNSQGAYARNDSQQIDRKPGGDSVYVETHYYFYYVALQGSAAAYHQGGSDQTTRTSTGTWKSYSESLALSSKGEKARGRIHVCEDQNNAPDDCSAFATTTFSY